MKEYCGDWVTCLVLFVSAGGVRVQRVDFVSRYDVAVFRAGRVVVHFGGGGLSVGVRGRRGRVLLGGPLALFLGRGEGLCAGWSSPAGNFPGRVFR